MDPPPQGESSSLGEAQDISFIKEFVHSSQRGKERKVYSVFRTVFLLLLLLVVAVGCPAAGFG